MSGRAVPKQLEVLEQFTCVRFHQHGTFGVDADAEKMLMLFGVYVGIIFVGKTKFLMVCRPLVVGGIFVASSLQRSRMERQRFSWIGGNGDWKGVWGQDSILDTP